MSGSKLFEHLMDIYSVKFMVYFRTFKIFEIDILKFYQHISIRRKCLTINEQLVYTAQERPRAKATKVNFPA